MAKDIVLERGITILSTKSQITIDGLYPTDGTVVENPFVGMPLKDLCKTYIHSLSRFYKINVPLPVMASQ